MLLAKTEATEHVAETFDRLGGRVPVLPLIESAVGIEEAFSIARARGTFPLAFGSGAVALFEQRLRPGQPDLASSTDLTADRYRAHRHDR